MSDKVPSLARLDLEVGGEGSVGRRGLLLGLGPYGGPLFGGPLDAVDNGGVTSWPLLVAMLGEYGGSG